MTVLAIETATKQLGVAAVDGEQVLASYELLAEYPHAVELPAAVTRVLQSARVALKDLAAIAVDVGPGSFTGLRIGLAFVKALAFATKVPLIGVPSLDVLAANVSFAPLPVCPLLDAKQKNLYAAWYRPEHGRWTRTTDYLLGPADDVLARAKEPTLFLGDGILLYRERILQRCPKAQFAPQELWLPRAATLGRLALERLAAGQTDDPAKLVPLYLYPKDCQVRGPNRPTSVLSRQESPESRGLPPTSQPVAKPA